MCFAGDRGATLAVDVAAVLVVVVDKTECAVVLVEEGVGEATRTAGVAEMFAASRRGTSVRMSPVESTDGGIGEAMGNGSVCRCSSIGREYTRASCLSVNTTNA